MSKYPVNETALLLVDPLNEFLSEGGKLWEMTKGTAETAGTIANLKKLTDACRHAGIQVVYALHHAGTGDDYDNWKFLNPAQQAIKDNQVFIKGSFGAEVHPDVTPQVGDLIAQEHWTSSGFANTDLDLLLKQHGIQRVVIAGNRANTCIDSTGRYAVELGYHATLISDAIAAFSEAEMEATININWPAFGHAVLTTDQFLKQI
ncbi:cysteine hydrolase family protein [Microbulbifer sp. SSSA007]|uniref:cysteine hydrolase family protein n=1 Tax=Microbulbifer sp. SSSA007 TaxID=3243379 RepID=UPI00403A23C9